MSYLDSDMLPPIATFGPETIVRTGSLREVVDGCLSDQASDSVFYHAAETAFQSSNVELIPGVSLLGGLSCPEIYDNPLQRTLDVTTACLHDIIYSGQSTTVHSLGRGFYEPTSRLFGTASNSPEITKVEPAYCVDDAGRLRLGQRLSTVPSLPYSVIPICGIGIYNFGHFLYDGLPAALQYKTATAGKPFMFVSNEIRPWQKAILEALGLASMHVDVKTPVRFRSALVTGFTSQHVGYPSRFIRPVFDSLRFQFGADRRQPGRAVFLSRRNDTSRRYLTNRIALEAALDDAGVRIVLPEHLSLAEAVRTLASASLVIGEMGAAMANVGFCDPGTDVLEIQQQGRPDGWTRATCSLMGLRWHLYLASADPRADELYSGVAQPDGVFAVDVAAVVEAVRTILGRAE